MFSATSLSYSEYITFLNSPLPFVLNNTFPLFVSLNDISLFTNAKYLKASSIYPTSV